MTYPGGSQLHPVISMVVAMCLAVVAAGCQRAAQQPSSVANVGASRTSTPRCWIYDKIYPVTGAAFKSQHVTSAEHREIEKWAMPVSPSEQNNQTRFPFGGPPLPSEQHLVRWMRSQRGIFVFVARPVYRPDPKNPPGVYYPWMAINTNMVIDTVSCDIHAYPTA